MSLNEFFRLYPDYEVTWGQLAYANYLERCGLRFLVDFGFENAESLAWDKLEAEEFILGHA